MPVVPLPQHFGQMILAETSLKTFILYLWAEVVSDERWISVDKVFGEMQLADARYCSAPSLKLTVLELVKISHHLVVLLFHIQGVFSLYYTEIYIHTLKQFRMQLSMVGCFLCLYIHKNIHLYKNVRLSVV